MNNIDEIRKSFSRQAAGFEHTLHFSKQEYLVHLADRLAPAPGARVLETAAGTCACGRAIAPRVAEVTCLDITPEMLAVGRGSAEKAGLKNMRFVEGNVNALPFEDGSFDIVMTRLSFHHFTDIQKPFDEMDRVLKSGGQLAVIDIEAADEDVRDKTDRIETMRDPSHTRTLSAQELIKPFERHGYDMVCREIARFESNLEDWMELTSTPAETRAEIRRIMLNDIERGERTGFKPFLRDGKIFFEHRWLMLIGRKS